MVGLLGAPPDPPGQTKLAWLTEQMPHLVAAAETLLATKGIEAPTRPQLRAAVKERMFVFCQRRRPHAPGTREGRPPPPTPGPSPRPAATTSAAPGRKSIRGSHGGSDAG